ncbi:MAG: SPFH domain-containing protein [Cyanobacteriota bacterium]
MLGIKFIKAHPTTYLIKFVDGKIKKEGSGISFFYFAPTTSLVSIPSASKDAPFIVKETTADFQQVTIQGQIVYKITEPKLIAEMMNFTLDSTGNTYASEDPEKLENRIINHVQVLTRAELLKTPLKEAIKMSDVLAERILPKVRGLESIKSLGIEILDLSIVAINPTPETARALEAEVREQLLKDADSAIYSRRNAAVEQERAIKENELKTEMSIQEKKQQMKMAEVNSNIALEEENKKLVSLSAESTKIQADAKAYELNATLKPFTLIDPKVLQVLSQSQMNSGQLIAQAFRDLSENTDKIGQLNVTPDLLKTLIDQNNG